MVSPPSHCPEGDHLVDGLFSHGCGSQGMEEKGLAGAKSRWSLTADKGGCVVHSVGSPLCTFAPDSGTFSQ